MTGRIMPLCERDTSTIQAAADAFCPRGGTSTRIPAVAMPATPGTGGPLRIVTAPRSHGTRYPPIGAVLRWEAPRSMPCRSAQYFETEGMRGGGLELDADFGFRFACGVPELGHRS
jgi:hypothetical protein